MAMYILLRQWSVVNGIFWYLYKVCNLLKFCGYRNLTKEHLFVGVLHIPTLQMSKHSLCAIG